MKNIYCRLFKVLMLFSIFCFFLKPDYACAQDLVIPDDILVECGSSILPTSSGEAYLGGGAFPTASDGTASDGCGAIDIYYEDDITALTACNGTGVIVRTWTATSESCGTLSGEQQIVIADDTAPNLFVPDEVTLECGGSLDPSYGLVGLATASDGCGNTAAITPVYQDDLSGLTACSNTGIIVRTWSATDACGNVSTMDQLITLEDNTPPSLTCPSTLSLGNNPDSVPSPDVNSVAASDGCDDNPTITHLGDDMTTENCITTIYRTYQATDECGNAVECTQEIIYTVGGPSVVATLDNYSCGNTYGLNLTISGNDSGEFNVHVNGLAIGSTYSYDASGTTDLEINGIAFDPSLSESSVVIEINDLTSCSGATSLTLPTYYVCNEPQSDNNDNTVDVDVPGSSVISSKVFHDLDGDGIQDPGEMGIAGIQVTLVLPNGDELTTYTDADGNYTFAGLSEGSYTIIVGNGPASYDSTTANFYTITINENGDTIIGQSDFGFEADDVPPIEFCSVPSMTLCVEAAEPTNICLPDYLSGPDYTITNVDVLYPCSTGINGGCIEYTALPGFAGTEYMVITTCNDSGACVQYCVEIVVGNCNTPPVAQPDVVDASCDAVTIDVLSNDSDPDGDNISICDNSQPSYGSVTLSGNNFIYTPNGTHCGTDIFVYTICDASGAMSTALVTINAACGCVVNTPPVAVSDYHSTPHNTPVTIPALNNDSDPDGDDIYICGNTAPVNGTVVQSGDNFIYTPNAGFVGVDTFTYTICDGEGGQSTTTIYVDVAMGITPCTNDPISECITPNESLTICPDFCGLTGAYEITGVSNLYQCSINTDNGCVTYTPLPAFLGNETLEITACNNAACDNLTIYVTVAESCGSDNNPPVAVDDVNTSNGDPVTINVLGNDSDPDGDNLTVCGNTAPVNGTVAQSGNNFIYTPAPGFSGTDTFTYTICDGNGGEDTATVYITVDGGVEPCVNTPITDCTELMTSITLCPDFCQFDGQAYEITDVNTNYPCSINVDNGCFVYTPLPGFSGVENIIVTACAGTVCHEAFITITVAESCNPNNPPNAVDDSTNSDGGPITVIVIGNDSDPDGDDLTVCNYTQASNGSVTQVGNGFVYTPNAGFYGVDTYTYTICDGNGGEDTATVTITVTEPDGDCDEVLNVCTEPVTPVEVCVDFCGLTGPVTIISAVTTYNCAIDSEGTDGCFTYTPLPGFEIDDVIVVDACDSFGNCATANINVTIGCVVEPTNTAPIANNDTGSSDGSPITINVIANDSDPDGDNLTICSYGQGVNGTVTLVGGQLVYTPNAGFYGIDVFTYTICDGNGGEDTATVTVTVTEPEPTNTAPNANDDTTTSDGGPVPIDVLGNDSDPDGDNLTICNYSQGVNGMVTLVGGQLVYTPNAGFSGTDVFTYTICDGNGGEDTAVVTVFVEDEECDEVLSVCTEPITPVEVCVDFCGLTGPITIVSAVTTYNCSIETNGDDGCFTYTPLPEFFIDDIIQVEACDGFGNCANATIFVSIGDCDGSNGAPNANDDTTTSTGGPVTIDVIGNDSDPDGDDLSICNYTQGINGTVTLVGGQLVYTPNAGFSGIDIITYTICDGNGGEDTATITVTVEEPEPTNQSPIANNDTATSTGGPVTVNVIGNDSDPDGDNLTICNYSQGINGTVTLVGGQLVYTPNAGFYGIDIISYTICDGNGGEDTATLTVTVSEPVPTNQSPTANNDTATSTGGPVTVNVIGNDSDPDGDTLTICNYSQGINGTVTLVGGQLVYTPNAGFYGVDVITYTVCDGNGGEDTATLTVTVTEPEPTNSNPIANNDTATSNGSPVTINVIGNDSDPDGDTLTICEHSQGINGTVTLVDGQLVYTPNAGFYGIDVITYTICDGNGGQDTGTVTVTVSEPVPTNQSPIANNDTAESDGGPVTINVVGNDSDPDGDDLTICNYSQGTHGTVTLVGGQLVYTPNGGFYGTDNFTYTICDGNGGEATATVTVTVSDPCSTINITPSNQNPMMVIDAGTSATYASPCGYIDPSSLVMPSNGMVTLENGNLIYTPNAGFIGSDVISFSSLQVVGDCSPVVCANVVLTINVEPAIEVVANDDVYTTLNTNPATINILQNDVYPAGSIEITIVTPPISGTVVVNDNNTLTYIPEPGFSGTVTFTYMLCIDGVCDTAVVTVVVEDNSQCGLEMPSTILMNGTNFNQLMKSDQEKLNTCDCYSNAELELVVVSMSGDIVYTEKASANDFQGWNNSRMNKSMKMANSDTFIYTILVDGQPIAANQYGQIIMFR